MAIHQKRTEMKELPCGLLWPGSEPLPFEPAFLEVALCDSAGFATCAFPFE